MKKLVMVALVVSLMLPLMCQPGQAAYSWIYANISQVGPATGGSWMVVGAADGSFPAQWFPIDATLNNQILATAFTAMANTRQVRVYLDPTNASLPITGLLLTDQ
jgi:hypothetical protein